MHHGVCQGYGVPVYSHTEFSNKLKGMQDISNALCLTGSIFFGTLSHTLQLPRLPQSPVVLGSGKHCVLSQSAAGRKPGRSRYSAVLFSFSWVHYLLPNVLKVFFFFKYIFHLLYCGRPRESFLSLHHSGRSSR